MENVIPLDLKAIMCGALAGMAAMALGFAKNAATVRDFQLRGLVLKLPIGLVVGGIAGAREMSFESAETWAAAIGIIAIVESVTKSIMRRIFPDWMSLEEATKINPLTSRPPLPPGTASLLLAASLTAIFSGGCFIAPKAIDKGHESAATCVQRSRANYEATVEGLAQALRQERRAHVEYAVQKAMDNVRLEAAKDGGKIDAEKAVKYIQEAYASRDREVAAMEATIRRFRAAADAGDREARIALDLMGELRKYDASGIEPDKVVSEASSYVPALRAPELENK